MYIHNKPAAYTFQGRDFNASRRIAAFLHFGAIFLYANEYFYFVDISQQQLFFAGIISTFTLPLLL